VGQILVRDRRESPSDERDDESVRPEAQTCAGMGLEARASEEHAKRAGLAESQSTRRAADACAAPLRRA
jgi:hypothetical protein